MKNKENSILPTIKSSLVIYSIVMYLFVGIVLIRFILLSSFGIGTIFELILLSLLVIFFINSLYDVCLDENYIYFYHFLFRHKIKLEDIRYIKLRDKGLANFILESFA